MSATKRGILRLGAFALVLAAAVEAPLADPVAALIQVDFTNVAFAQTTGVTSIPIGHMEFCRRMRAECTANDNRVEAEFLSSYRWDQLVEINNGVNAEIVPVTDLDYYGVGEVWAYPTDGYGDCEDYALEKRRMLIELGWNPSTLLMAVVRQANGDGHAVLMVRTDRGDLVLDNLDSKIRVWSETSYQFIKRQSQANAGEWVLIDDSRSVVTVASTN